MIAALAAGLTLAGCSTAGDGADRALSLLPAGGKAKASDDAETAILAALNGGIIGSVAGETLGERDRRKALAAEYRALETAPVGRSVTWRGDRSGLLGEVSAAQAYQVGSQNCRHYTHRVEGGARPMVANGTACRSEDGVWTPVS